VDFPNPFTLSWNAQSHQQFNITLPNKGAVSKLGILSAAGVENSRSPFLYLHNTVALLTVHPTTSATLD